MDKLNNLIKECAIDLPEDLIDDKSISVEKKNIDNKKLDNSFLINTTHEKKSRNSTISQNLNRIFNNNCVHSEDISTKDNNHDVSCNSYNSIFIQAQDLNKKNVILLPKNYFKNININILNEDINSIRNYSIKNEKKSIEKNSSTSTNINSGKFQNLCIKKEKINKTLSSQRIILNTTNQDINYKLKTSLCKNPKIDNNPNFFKNFDDENKINKNDTRKSTPLRNYISNKVCKNSINIDEKKLEKNKTFDNSIKNNVYGKNKDLNHSHISNKLDNISSNPNSYRKGLISEYNSTDNKKLLLKDKKFEISQDTTVSNNIIKNDSKNNIGKDLKKIQFDVSEFKYIN